MDWDSILKEHDDAVARGEIKEGFPVMPKGKYDVVVEAAEAITAQSSGAKMIKLELRVTTPGEHMNQRLWTNLVFSKGNPKAMGFTIRKLAGLGISRDFLSSANPSTEQLAKMIHGAVCEVEVYIKPAEGEYKEKNEVGSFRQKLGEGGAAPKAPRLPKPAGVPDVSSAAAPPKPRVPKAPEPETVADPEEAYEEAPADEEEPF